MSYSKTLKIRAAKDLSRSVALEYRTKPVTLIQARLVGRTSLTPKIELEEYSCSAVMDWVDISFELMRPTQFRYVQDVLSEITGRRAWVRPVDPGPGNVSTIFNVRFQEPHLYQLRKSAEKLTMKFGMASEPFVYGLEVSVDFRPTTVSEDKRWRMASILSRHLFPGRDVVSAFMDRPRFAWGVGDKLSRHSHNAVEHPRIVGNDADVFLNTAGDAPAPPDATVYIGDKFGPARWRVMDKIRDRQNPFEDKWLDLPEDEKRARVEVTLNRLELPKLGIRSLDSLLRFNFAQLQGDYFRFMLPTFLAADNTATHADRHWEPQRQTRFLNTGVVGLLAMDERRNLLRRGNRKTLASHLRAKGLKITPEPRAGRGAAGTLMAYQALNDRVAMALQKLVERERGMGWKRLK